MTFDCKPRLGRDEKVKLWAWDSYGFVFIYISLFTNYSQKGLFFNTSTKYYYYNAPVQSLLNYEERKGHFLGR